MHQAHLQNSQLGWIIAGVILLGLAGVLGLMASLFLSNLRQAAKARATADAAHAEALQRLGASTVHDVRPMLGDMHCAPGVRLQVDAPDEAVPVLAVEHELRELFAQIAAYAGRVMRAGATLHVSARAEARHAVIHWREIDAGDVHPALSRFFDRTQAVVSDTSAALCERIAALHGGRIYAAPHEDGTLGLTLRLPMAP